MNDKQILLLAAKDAVISKFRFQVKDWSSEVWWFQVDEIHQALHTLPASKREGILHLYRGNKDE